MVKELLVILLLILANGVFAAAEIAILSIRKTRIHELISTGNGAAAVVQRLRRRPERFLATVQIGITVIGVAAGAFGGAVLARPIARGIRALGFDTTAEGISLSLVVALISFLSLVIGELVPKSLALRYPERYGLWISRPILGLATVAAPLVWLLTASSNVILRFFGDRTTFTETRLSEEELRELVEEAADAGELDPRTGDIATRAMDFGRLTAGEVTVPRSLVVSVEKRTAVREAATVLLASGHSRLPVYDRSPEQIVGYITVWTILEALSSGAAATAADLMRPVEFVPQSAPAMDVLRRLQQRRTQLAVVVDESGGVAGIVTVEDLVEELVGEIWSEHDAPQASIERESDESAIVSASVPIREVNRALALELPESSDTVTLGGLASKLARKIPEAGVVLETDHAVLEVLESSPRRVLRIRVRHPKRAEHSLA